MVTTAVYMDYDGFDILILQNEKLDVLSMQTEKIRELVGSMLKSVTSYRGILNKIHKSLASLGSWRCFLALVLAGLFLLIVYLPYAVPVSSTR